MSLMTRATANGTRRRGRRHTRASNALFERYEELKIRYLDADRDGKPEAEQLGKEVESLFQKWDRMTLNGD